MEKIMKERPLISVTVPVFNTSKYLRQCLESLEKQTLQDIEFIVVDDGSTDDSGEICDEFAEKDKRFKVIHQKNGGLAVARQTGLDAAQGEYVIVCDSDDWTEPDMYERLYNKAIETGADMVVCGYFAEYPDGKSVPKQTWFLEKDGFVDNDDLLRRGAGNSWVKLVKKSLFERAGASYEPGINMGEDALITYKLLKGWPKISQIKVNIYHYRRMFGGDSYTNRIKMASVHQMRFSYDWLKEHYSHEKYESFLFQRVINIAFACLRVDKVDKKYVDALLTTEVPFYRFIKNHKSLKSFIVFIEKYFPIYISRWLLRVFYRYIYK